MSGARTSVIDLPIEEELLLDCIVTFSGHDRKGKQYSRVVGFNDYDKGKVKPEDVLTIYPEHDLLLSTRLILRGVVKQNGQREFDYSSMQSLDQIFTYGSKGVSDANPLLKYPPKTGTV